VIPPDAEASPSEEGAAEPDESDRLARVARLFDSPSRSLRSGEGEAMAAKSKIRFEERSPLSMMHTGLGVKAWKRMLYQIDEGVFA